MMKVAHPMAQPVGEPPAALPMPPIRRRLFVCLQSVEWKKKKKKWDNSNFAHFLDSKIRV